MQIKSIAVGATIALIAGVGSVSADEHSVADTAGMQIGMLNGIETLELSVQDNGHRDGDLLQVRTQRGYQPPLRGAPTRRVGGATRGAGA